MMEAYVIKLEDGTYLKSEWNESLQCIDVWRTKDIIRADFFEVEAAHKLFNKINGTEESIEEYNFYYNVKPNKIIKVNIVEVDENESTV